MYQNLVADVDPAAPDSVHLTRWPAAELAPLRDEALEAAMGVARRAVDLSRTLRGRPGSRSASRWPGSGSPCPAGRSAEMDALLGSFADEVNVKAVELIGDESELVDRRVKPLLPRIGQAPGRGDPGRHGGRPRGPVRDPRRRFGDRSPA